MAAKFKITDEVRAVLEAASITATSVKLNGQVDRALYVAVNKVLVGAGGKWDRMTEKLNGMLPTGSRIKDLPAGTFRSAGTDVRCCLLIVGG